jgi:hypothetical protein
MNLEGEVERRGDRVRVRMRLCRGGFIVAALRETFDVSEIGAALARTREFLPKELRDDPKIAAAFHDPGEEIWRHRLDLWRGL